MDFKLNTRSNFMGQPGKITAPTFNWKFTDEKAVDTLDKALQKGGDYLDKWVEKVEGRAYEEDKRKKLIKEREDWLNKMLGLDDDELDTAIKDKEQELSNLSESYNDDGTLKISKYVPENELTTGEIGISSFEPGNIVDRLLKVPGGEIIATPKGDIFRYNDKDYPISGLEMNQYDTEFEY